MAVSSIRFTQKSVNDTFSNGAPIKWTINMLKTKQIKPCEIPLIRVGFHNGYYKSIDNRRLYCYKTANIKKIPVIMMDRITKEFYCKDQSPNNGLYVKIISDPKPVSCHRNMVIAFNPNTRKTRSWRVGDIISECKAMNRSTKSKKRKRSKNTSNNGTITTPSKSKKDTIWRPKPNGSATTTPSKSNNGKIWKPKSKSTQSTDPKTNVAAMNEKSHLKKQNEKSEGRPKKAAPSKAIISVNNNNDNNELKSSITAKTELNKNNNTNSKIAIDSSQFEFQEKMATKNKEIEALELKLKDEKLKCKSLVIINKKLQNELLINSNNNKRHDIMIDSMKQQMNYLRNRISEQEMELNEYKENRESLDVVIDIGMNDVDAKIIGVDYHWFCCCCKKRKD